jgi:microcystin-dependent protein
LTWRTADTASKLFAATLSTPGRGSDEIEGLPQSAVFGIHTAGSDGPIGVGVSGTLSGSMGGSIVTNPGTTNSTGGGEAHSNMQPFLVATKIIKH